MHSTKRNSIHALLSEMKRENLLPSNLALQNLTKSMFIASIFKENQDGHGLFIRNGGEGFGSSPTLAFSKALSEYFERVAFDECSIKSSKYRSTDGFAAYPILGDGDHKYHARRNALVECVERFVISHWWDDRKTSFNISTLEDSKSRTVDEGIQLVYSKGNSSTIYIVEPLFSSPFPNLDVVLAIQETTSGGFVSGSASGESKDREQTIFKALFELSRHSEVGQRALRNRVIASGPYEKNLIYYMGKEGGREVRKRLNQSGSETIIVDDIDEDYEIEYSCSDYVYVHRVQLRNQPISFWSEKRRFVL